MSEGKLRPIRLILLNQRWIVVAVVLLVCANGLLSLAPAFLGGRVVESLPARDLPAATRFALLMLGSIIVSGFLGAVEGYLVSLAGERFGRDARARIYGQLLRLPMKFFRAKAAGEMMNRVDSDVDTLSSAVVGSLEPTAASLVSFAVTIAVMFVADWRLTLVAVVTVPLWALASAPASGPLARLRMELIAAHDRLASLTNETLSTGGITIIKGAGRYADEETRFREAFRAMMRARLRAALLVRGLQSVLTVVAGIGPALILVFGAWSTYHGYTSLGTLVAFLSLQGRLYAPVGQLSNLKLQLATLKAVLARINEVLSEPHEHDGGSVEVAAPELVARDLSYELDGRAIVERSSFEIPAGARAAFVGPSGCGKTTLASLLARFEQPTGGALSLGGVPFEHIALGALRRMVHLVPQQSFLFTRSLRENLTMFRPDASDEELRAALAVAQAQGIVDAQPAGLDTVVGSTRARLSGGEMQRLAIARALVARPDILILDEATSALDAATEAAILRGLDEHASRATVVYVTHRPHTVPRIDVTVDLSQAVPA